MHAEMVKSWHVRHAKKAARKKKDGKKEKEGGKKRMMTSKKKKISALSFSLNTGRTFIGMNDSSRNRWKRAERHSEKHQILMQFFLPFCSRDRQNFFFVTNLYI